MAFEKAKEYLENNNLDNRIIILDKSLKKYEYVYLACGSSNSSVKIKVSKLESIIPYEDYIDISK